MILEAVTSYLVAASKLPISDQKKLGDILSTALQADKASGQPSQDFWARDFSKLGLPACPLAKPQDELSQLQSVLSDIQLAFLSTDIANRIAQPRVADPLISDTIRKFFASTCAGHPVVLPQNLRCEIYMGGGRLKEGQEVSWTPFTSFNPQTQAYSVNPPPIQTSFWGLGPDTTTQTFSETLAPKIKSEIDQGRAVGVSICSDLLTSDTISLDHPSACPRQQTSIVPGTIVIPNHDVALIGYRSILDPDTKQCETEYLVFNSWGATCEHIGKALLSRCDPATGKIWVPEKLLKENSTDFSFARLSDD